MRRLHVTGAAGVAVLGVSCLAIALAIADPKAKPVPKPEQSPAPPPTAEQIRAAKSAFGDVYKVLVSPRCRNCHPKGDRPLQGDKGAPHAMNISRVSFESGLECTTCHSDRNSEDTIGLAGGPPGALHWGLPPKETPMVFEGHTPRSLCEQLKDPKRNGKRSLADLVHHVGHDALVLWGWNPGGKRTVPPITHKAFVAAMTRWAEGGGACPEPTR